MLGRLVAEHCLEPANYVCTNIDIVLKGHRRPLHDADAFVLHKVRSIQRLMSTCEEVERAKNFTAQNSVSSVLGNEKPCFLNFSKGSGVS